MKHQPTDQSTTRSRAAVRYILGSLLAFGALNAFAGGFYGLSGAENIPMEWLEGSPFTSYFIPSLFLFVVVGGSFLASSITVFARSRFDRLFALGTGILVLSWIAVQVAIIGLISWMQPTTAGAGVLVLVLAWLLPASSRNRISLKRYPPNVYDSRPWP